MHVEAYLYRNTKESGNAEHADADLHSSSASEFKETNGQHIGPDRSRAIRAVREYKRAESESASLRRYNAAARQCSVTVTAFRGSISSRAFGVDRSESGWGTVRHVLQTDTKWKRQRRKRGSVRARRVRSVARRPKEGERVTER